MRKSVLSLAIASALAVPTVTLAQTAPAAAPASPITGNMTIATDYRFRGISQTFKGPTIQGGLDYAHESGFYVGNWNSNVSGLQYIGGAGIEMDFYGGFKKSFGDIGLDVGLLQYYYGDARQNGSSLPLGGTASRVKYDNREVYIAGSWKWLTVKYNYSLTDYFGLNGQVGNQAISQTCAKAGCAATQAGGTLVGDHGGSKGTGYLDVSASYEVMAKTTLVGHIGWLKMKNYSSYYNYTDYKLGVNYDWTGWTLGAAIVGSNAKNDWYYVSGNKIPANFKNLGDTTIVLSVGKTF
jgi:uncharacterized protein (TIGR02001 family)